MTRRHSAVLIALAVLAAACGDTNLDDSVSSTTSTTGSPTSVTSTVVSTEVTTAPSSPTTTAPPGTVTLTNLRPVEGDAPVRIVDPEYPVVYADYTPADMIPPPEGVAIDLHRCLLAGPGVVVYEMTTTGPDTIWPLMTSAVGGLSAGDMGTGTWGTVTLDGPGTVWFVTSLPDNAAALDWEGRQEERGDRVDRDVDWARPGMQCHVEFGSEYRIRSNYVDLEDHPMALEVTGPPATVESLAQAAFAAGEEAPLRPVAVAFGEAHRLYAERWFLPTDPTRLETIDERLDDDGCLEVEFEYESYQVTQRRGCTMPDRDPVYEAGGSWFATTTDGTWVVQVRAADRETAETIATSLSPYWHLHHRDIPLAPISEREIGRAPFQGGEVLVTFGEQRCPASGPCRSPEGWFYVYRIAGDDLVEYAHYPGYDACLLAEEDPFILAVAPRRGSIAIDRPGGTETIHSDETTSFAFIEKTGEPVEVRVLDENGSVPRCIGARDGDTRGGIEPFPGSTTTTIPEAAAERSIDMVPCTTVPAMIDEFTDTEPLAVACAATPKGTLTVAHIVPNQMMAEPPDGLDCLVDVLGQGAGGSCWPDGEPPEPIVSGYDDLWTLSALVPEGTTRVVAVTDRGTEITTEPLDGLAVIWWRPAEGDIDGVVAETPTGPVSIFGG